MFSIDGIKGRVDPYAGSSEEEAPVGNILLEGVIEPQHVHIRKDDEDPTNKGNEVGCDPFRNQRDDPLPIRVQQTVDFGVLAGFVLVVA